MILKKSVTRLPGKSGILSLEYRLIGTMLRDGGKSFSVAVSLKTKNGTETALASDLARSVSRARRIFFRLYRGTVTPCALGDVLEELL